MYLLLYTYKNTYNIKVIKWEEHKENKERKKIL